MDTTDYPSLAQLSRLNAQLAVHCARVDAIINGQLDVVERLFRAATDRDWDAVARASQDLAHNLSTARTARSCSPHGACTRRLAAIPRAARPPASSQLC